MGSHKIKIKTSVVDASKSRKTYYLVPVIATTDSVMDWQFRRCDRTWQFYGYLEDLFFQYFGPPVNSASNFNSKEGGRWAKCEAGFLFNSSDDLLLAKLSIDISELERLAP